MQQYDRELRRRLIPPNSYTGAQLPMAQPRLYPLSPHSTPLCIYAPTSKFHSILNRLLDHRISGTSGLKRQYKESGPSVPACASLYGSVGSNESITQSLEAEKICTNLNPLYDELGPRWGCNREGSMYQSSYLHIPSSSRLYPRRLDVNWRHNFRPADDNDCNVEDMYVHLAEHP